MAIAGSTRAVVLAALALALTVARPARAAPTTWVLDVSAGVPTLQSDDFHVVGDATLGFAAPSFGGVGRGALGFVSFDSAVASNVMLREEGYLDGWWVSGDDDATWRFEAGLSGGAAIYSSTFEPKVAGAGFYHDEDSLMRRVSGTAGVRFLDERVSFRLKAGVGAQQEVYAYLSTDPSDPSVLLDTESTSVREDVRALLRWRLIERTLSLRLRFELEHFSITRSALAVGTAGGALGATLSNETFGQTDIGMRAFVDVDRIAFFGIVPAAFGGFDYTALAGDAGSATALVPVFGLGLFKTEEQ